ncbi:MAG: tRNA pseudouridine(55) synthase TruB [Chloroflexota bacterium]
MSLVRRWSRVRRVGHAGTLDPAASGILLVCLGQGTRVVEFLSSMTKAYWARIELGIATDTYDAQGKVTQRGDPSSVDREQMHSLLNSFLGCIEQVPPMFSAIKRAGTPLYRLARSGIVVERRSRKVEIYGISLLEWEPPLLTIGVECSKGTYIRSLAHDIGQTLGCGAHLKNLVRWRSGPFHIQDSVTLPKLEAAIGYEGWQRLLHPLDTALLDKLAAIVGKDREKVIVSGQSLSLGGTAMEEPSPTGEKWCRAYSMEGKIVALLRLEQDGMLWHPKKVFAGGPLSSASNS